MGEEKMRVEEELKPIAFFGDATPSLGELYYLIELPDKYIAGDYTEAGMYAVEGTLVGIREGTIVGKPIGVKSLKTILKEFPKETRVLAEGTDLVRKFIEENNIGTLEDLEEAIGG